MKRLSACLLLILFGCSDPVADAKAERDIVLKHGGDRCAAERKYQEELLKAHREEDYAHQSMIAEATCLSVETGRNVRMVPPY